MKIVWGLLSTVWLEEWEGVGVEPPHDETGWLDNALSLELNVIMPATCGVECNVNPFLGLFG